MVCARSLRIYLPEASAIDEAFTDAAPQFARVSRCTVDHATPSRVVAGSVVLAGIDWDLPVLHQPLVNMLEQVADRRGHGYRVVQYESIEPIPLKTARLAAPQSVVIFVPGVRR